MERLFVVTNFRNAFYVSFEQCIETLRILQRGSVSAKADLLFSLADEMNTGNIGLSDIEMLLETSKHNFDIVKERRKNTGAKVMLAAFKYRDAYDQAQGRGPHDVVDAEKLISREEFVNAAESCKEVGRFCERLGFLR